VRAPQRARDQAVVHASVHLMVTAGIARPRPASPHTAQAPGAASSEFGSGLKRTAAQRDGEASPGLFGAGFPVFRCVLQTAKRQRHECSTPTSRGMVNICCQ
jgi:hypothetical protein